MNPNENTNPAEPGMRPGVPPQTAGQPFGTPTTAATVPPPAPQQVYNQPVYPAPQSQPPVPAYQNNPPTTPPSDNRKRKLSVVIAVAIAVIGIAAFFVFGGAKQIANKVAGLELVSYSNQNLTFSIKVPKDWEAKETIGEFFKQVTFIEPVGDIKDSSESNKYYAIVRVDYQSADQAYLEKTEQEYFDGIKKGLQQAASNTDNGGGSASYVPESAKIESEQAATVNGLKAYKTKLKITNFEGKKDNVGYEYGLFVFVDSKNQYEVTIKAHESESVNGKANDILTSFARQ